jgi:hypothetical protein
MFHQKRCTAQTALSKPKQTMPYAPEFDPGKSRVMDDRRQFHRFMSDDGENLLIVSLHLQQTSSSTSASTPQSACRHPAAPRRLWLCKNEQATLYMNKKFHQCHDFRIQ